MSAYDEMKDRQHKLNCQVAIAGFICLTVVILVTIGAMVFNSYDYRRHVKNLDAPLRVACQQARGEWVSHHDGTPYCTWPK